MPAVLKKYKAAAVQAEPGWFNLEESVQKTINWIKEAGEAGCKLVAFPEVCKLHTQPKRLARASSDCVPRDPRLPLLDVEDQLPTVSSLLEAVQAEQSTCRL